MSVTLPLDTYPAPRHGWVCFHCGETFSVAKQKSLAAAIVAAREHFGPTPLSLPACVDRATHTDAELVKRTRQAEADADQFRNERDRAEEEAESAQSELSSLSSRFPGATSVYDAWCQFHSMEGRALAAEAIVAAAEKLAPEIIQKAREIVCGPEPHGELHAPHTSMGQTETQAC